MKLTAFQARSCRSLLDADIGIGKFNPFIGASPKATEPPRPRILGRDSVQKVLIPHTPLTASSVALT